MPLEKIAISLETDDLKPPTTLQQEVEQLAEYYLICFDKYGNERRESGALLSVKVEDLLRESYQSGHPFTDVFIIAHGWNNDIPSAKVTYNQWIRAMIGADTDCQEAVKKIKGFKPLIIGLHWPSLPFGDESIRECQSWLLSGDDELVVQKEVNKFAESISDTMAARNALRTIIGTALELQDTESVPREILDAYRTLFAESDLGATISSDSPDMEETPNIDPKVIMKMARRKQREAPDQLSGNLLGLYSMVKPIFDVVLAPARQWSFWKMKIRARRFGQTGANNFLRDLQKATPSTRFHLMGHSFGCIVASGMVAGQPNGKSPASPVHSLFLVQGALSLWSYADWIPSLDNISGYYNYIIRKKLVQGPILVTTSKADRALDEFYPVAVRVSGSKLLDSDEGNGDCCSSCDLETENKGPDYGAMGIYGIQGLEGVEAPQIVTMIPDEKGLQRYEFEPLKIYNINADMVIKEGKGLSGAHNDIAHVEVAHAFWAAILRDPLTSTTGEKGREGPRLTLVSEHKAKTRATRSKLLSVEEPQLSHTNESPPPDLSDKARQLPISLKGTLLPPQSRYVRARIVGQDDRRPILIPRRTYNFAISVEVEDPFTGMTVPFNESGLFTKDSREITLTIYVESSDFHIYKCKDFLQVPPRGPSLNTAEFGVSPLKLGNSKLQVFIMAGYKFVQDIEYTFNVGVKPLEDVKSEIKGNLGSADSQHPRDMSIIMRPVSGVGYECIVVCSHGLLKGILQCGEIELYTLIEDTRKEIVELLLHEENNSLNFQDRIDFGEQDEKYALRVLATAGFDLFTQIFRANSSDDHSNKLADYLCKELGSATYRVQIIAERANIPWGILYIGRDIENPSWDYFIGMRHILDLKFPRNPNILLNLTPTIDRSPKLFVGANLTSDEHFNDYVQHQLDWWTERGSGGDIELSCRTTRAEVFEALRNPDIKDHIFYFYCHCRNSPGMQTGTSESCLRLKKGEDITLRELNRYGAQFEIYKSYPLIFINACGSARMSPIFYDSFVPYFMKKGARGVVGTECPVPGLFAQSWAESFFEHFLNGEPLGDVFFNLRHEFLRKFHNPFGLFYAVYCDGDTHILPAPVGRNRRMDS